MIYVYCVRFDQGISYKWYDLFIKIISEEQRRRVEKFHFFEDAQRSVLADILVRYMICKIVKTELNKLNFERNEYGKPFLKDISGIDFNVSHSGEWVVAAVCDSAIGIDIEKIKEIDYKIAERFFSGREYLELMSKDGFDRIDYFYQLWSLKESYIKNCGKGLSMPLNSFSIGVKNNVISLETDNERKNCFFKQYEIAHEYKLAVCSLKDEFPHKPEIFNVDNFYEEVYRLYET